MGWPGHWATASNRDLCTVSRVPNRDLVAQINAAIVVIVLCFGLDSYRLPELCWALSLYYSVYKFLLALRNWNDFEREYWLPFLAGNFPCSVERERMFVLFLSLAPWRIEIFREMLSIFFII